LKKELIEAKQRNKELEDENNKLNSQLFVIQQFQVNHNQNHYQEQQQYQAQDDQQGNNQEMGDYVPFNGSDSPVLIADD
jgi:Tfp pilus assembly protein PilN